MSPQHHKSKPPKGGLLPLAMVMTALGGLFMVGWVSLCSMRAAYAANAPLAAERRLALQNSKAYGRELALERALLASSTLTALQTGSLSTGWGALDTDLGWSGLQAYSMPSTPFTAPYQVSHSSTGHYTSSFPFNNNGLRPGDSFVSVQRLARPTSAGPAVANLQSPGGSPNYYDGGIDRYYHYLILKTICPCLAGDGFVIYRKPASALTEAAFGKPNASKPGGRDAYSLLVNGRVVVRDPASYFDSSTVSRGGTRYVGIASKSLYIQKHDPNNRIIGSDYSGTSASPLDLRPLDLPATASTTGPYDVAPATFTTNHLYRGELNVINNPSHTNNSLYHIQQRELTAGRATLLDITTNNNFGTSADAIWLSTVDASTGASPPVKPNDWSSGGYSLYRTLYIRTSRADLPHLRIQNGLVNQIIFIGCTSDADYTTAGTLDPRILLLLPHPTSPPPGVTEDFHFIGESNRRLILGVKDSLALNIDSYWSQANATVTAALGPTINAHTATTANPDAATSLDWRLIFINEGRHLTLWTTDQYLGSIKAALCGGFMTNWSIERLATEPSPLAITITPDWSASYTLATLAPRDGWLENYFMLVQP